VGLRCLIVDDNPGFLQTARKILEDGGITVIGAVSTSTEAVSQAARAEPDVALVDVVLGAESGFDLARRLATPAGRPGQLGDRRPRVIIISTHAAEDFADLIEVSPAIGFLPKWGLSAAAVLGLLRDAPQGHPGDG
jgi:DNA-binding NarL/FixJ family response regulator